MCARVDFGAVEKISFDCGGLGKAIVSAFASGRKASIPGFPPCGLGLEFHHVICMVTSVCLAASFLAVAAAVASASATTVTEIAMRT